MTCKQVSLVFAGPAYNYDMCLPRFYEECAKVWHAKPWWQTVDLDSKDIQPFTEAGHYDHILSPYSAEELDPPPLPPPYYASRGRRYVFHSDGYVPFEDRDVLPMLHDRYDAVSDIRLICPTLESMKDIIAIEVYGRSGHVESLNQNFISGLTVDDTLSIPLCRACLPLFLSVVNPGDIKFVVYHSNEAQLPFRLMIRHCQTGCTKISDGTSTRVMGTVLRNLGEDAPVIPRAWAFKFPLDHLAQGIAKIIVRMRRESGPFSESLDVGVSARDLGHRHADFPYPLTPESGFVVIPRDPRTLSDSPHYRYGLMQASSFYMFVGFRIMYALEADPKELLELPRKHVYYLDDRVFTYTRGRLSITDY